MEGVKQRDSEPVFASDALGIRQARSVAALTLNKFYLQHTNMTCFRQRMRIQSSNRTRMKQGVEEKMQKLMATMRDADVFVRPSKLPAAREISTPSHAFSSTPLYLNDAVELDTSVEVRRLQH
jgi:hypothetical protein